MSRASSADDGLVHIFARDLEEPRKARLTHIRKGVLRRPPTPKPPLSSSIRKGALHRLPSPTDIEVDPSVSEDRSDNGAGGDVVASIDALLELLAEIAIEATAPRGEVTQSAA